LKYGYVGNIAGHQHHEDPAKEVKEQDSATAPSLQIKGSQHSGLLEFLWSVWSVWGVFSYNYFPSKSEVFHSMIETVDLR